MSSRISLTSWGKSACLALVGHPSSDGITTKIPLWGRCFITFKKKGLSFAHDVSLQNSVDSYVCFELALLNSVFYFFVLYRSPPSKLCTVSDSISSNKNEFLSINPSANVFVLETSTYNIRTDSPILVELIDLVNSVINFLFQMTLLRWLTFLLESLTVALSPAPLDLFLSLTLVFFLQWLPSIGKFRSYCCLSFH